MCDVLHPAFMQYSNGTNAVFCTLEQEAKAGAATFFIKGSLNRPVLADKKWRQVNEIFFG